MQIYFICFFFNLNFDLISPTYTSRSYACKILTYFFAGQGGFCWIKSGTTLPAVVGVPVALVIMINFVALTWTVISIYKVRKVRLFRK